MIKQFNAFLQIGAVILSSLIISGHAVAANKHAIPLDGIVAIINDQVITQTELNEAMNAIKKQLEASNTTLPPKEVLRKQVLDQLINKKLQLQLGERMGVHVTDEEVNKAINGIAEGNKVTLAELMQKVNASGVSTSEYHKEIQEELLLQQIQQQAVGSKINITPQEVDDFTRSKTWQAYNTKEYHLEDILITLPETPSPQQIAASKKRAVDTLAKIRHGMSFSEAAASESGETNAMQGGDLGWRKLPEIPSAFADQLIHMKANDIMGPIQTPNGFHIIRLIALRNAGGQLKPADEHMQIQQLIFQRKLEEALQSWVTKLRSEAFINTNPEN